MGSGNRLDTEPRGETATVKTPFGEDEERLLQAYREADDRGRALIMATAEIVSDMASGAEAR